MPLPRNPLARTILVECAWAALRYNPWTKQVYDRICGKQKTRTKKAAVALARKIAVLAWAMLRDEKDWTPGKMIDVSESFGKMKPETKEVLQSKKPSANTVKPKTSPTAKTPKPKPRQARKLVSAG